MKRLLYLLVPFLIWGIERFCHAQTDGFSIVRIRNHLPFRAEWEVDASADFAKIQPFLNQQFYYLAKGAQAYAFVSEDGKFVLKLFKHHRMRPSLWAPFLPQYFSEKKTAKREALLNHDYASYLIAYEKLRDETGLLYLHLNKTSHLKQKLTLVDKLGITHTIALDDTSFLIQKKATLAVSVLKQLREEGNLSLAQEKIADLLNLIVKRCQKGIFDKDPDFFTNFGFCENEAIQIDVGRFQNDISRSSQEIYHVDLIHAFDPLKKWLELHYPELLDEKDPLAYLTAHHPLHPSF